MLKLIPFLTILATLYSCNEDVALKETPNHEHSTKAFNIEYADHFKLAREGDDIILEIIHPENGSIDKTIQITPDSDLKIISLTSTLNGMLSILDGTDQLVGVSSIDYVFDNEIKERFNDNFILEYGDETTQSVEKILASSANIVFHSGFGDKFPNEDQLEKLGIRVIPVYDWREEDPLGKAEWIKLLGAITKKESEANSSFEKTVKEYNTLKQAASQLSGAPSVLSGNILGDIWYTPVGDSYVARLIADAAGNYVYKDSKGTGSLALSIETILNDNDSTKFWINPGIDSKEKVLKMNPHAKHLPSFENMYCYSPNMNKFWELSAAKPQLILSDLIHIFHPDFEDIQSFNFYQKIN